MFELVSTIRCPRQQLDRLLAKLGQIQDNSCNRWRDIEELDVVADAVTQDNEDHDKGLVAALPDDQTKVRPAEGNCKKGDPFGRKLSLCVYCYIFTSSFSKNIWVPAKKLYIKKISLKL